MSSSSLSLSDVAAIHNQLVEIEELINRLHTRNLTQVTTIRQELHLLYMLFVDVSRAVHLLGLGEEAETIISNIQRIIVVINMLRMAIYMLSLGTPFGYIHYVLSLVTVVGAIASLDDGSRGRRR